MGQLCHNWTLACLRGFKSNFTTHLRGDNAIRLMLLKPILACFPLNLTVAHTKGYFYTEYSGNLNYQFRTIQTLKHWGTGCGHYTDGLVNCSGAGPMSSNSVVDIFCIPIRKGMESQILNNTMIRQLPLNGAAEFKLHFTNTGCSMQWNGGTSKGYTCMTHNTSIIENIPMENIVMAPCPHGSDVSSSGNTFGHHPGLSKFRCNITW